MRRRDLVAMVSGAVAAWPLAARAQQAPVPVIGFLGVASAEAYGPPLAAFREGLKETGFAEGQNVAIEFRWAEGHYDRLPALATELVHRPVTVIVATGGNMAAMAARGASVTIPIVFTVGADPIQSGLVASLNRPGRPRRHWGSPSRNLSLPAPTR